MIFENYDKWRRDPLFRFTGTRDLKHVFPGLGTALCVFSVYVGYKYLQSLTAAAHAPYNHHHDDHHHH